MFFLKTLLKVFILALAVMLVVASVVLTMVASGSSGKLTGVFAFLLGTAPWLWCIGAERRSLHQVRLGQGFLVVGTIALLVIASLSPDGRTPEDARLCSRYSDGGWRYPRLHPGSAVPEIDQINLGFYAALMMDPYFNRAQFRELSAMTNAIYGEIKQSTEFEACGSALSSIYNEMAALNFRNGHYYHYIPANLDRTKPSRTLVFLHGSGGNFKAYVWLLSKMADRIGCTIIAPSFGLGNWEKAGADEAITTAIRDAGQHAAIDPDQIHLMGLSNGGKGVCLAESHAGPRFRSLIFLSAVFHNKIEPEDVARRFNQRPALIISGDRDDRVPWAYVNDYASRMEGAGMQVTRHRMDGEDHFLFFRRSDEVMDLLAKWLKRHS
jgi:pimeloyl-ACP methyl ester carboxylesterase